MVHMGGAGDGSKDCSEDVIAVAKRHPNMILVGSAIRIGKVENAIDILGPTRVMFGSDAPFFDAQTCVSNYRTMLKKYDENAANLVFGGNAQQLFGF
jgi:predicted TIM-barrel fold metal-dependent hydrolase